MPSRREQRTSETPTGSSIWFGVQTILDKYIKVSKDDHFLLSSTHDVALSAAWMKHAVDRRHMRCELMTMEPLIDANFLPCLRDHLRKRPSSGRFILVMLENDTVSHERDIHDAFRNYPVDSYLVVRLFGSSLTLLARSGMSTPEQLASFNATILDLCQRSEAIRVTTPSGSDLRIELDHSRFHWISMSGLLKPGRTLILPPGEVATHPASISGQFIADFALHSNVSAPEDVRIHHRPVTLRIDKDSVTSFHCADEEITSYLTGILSKPNALRIGELGFGTHLGATCATRENSHLNERCPGVHLGIGRHIQEAGDVDYECTVHVDLIAQGGRIESGHGSIDLSCVLPHSDWNSVLSEGQDVRSPPVCEIDCCTPLASRGSDNYL